MTTTPSSALRHESAQSFRQWSQARSLADNLSRVEADVRMRPQDAQMRWLLFELLCVLGQWERALKQLQTWAELSKEGVDSTAHVMRGLIRAEHARVEVLAGRAEVLTVSASETPVPAWMAGLSQALRVAAGELHAGNEDLQASEASDAAREAALAQAPDTPGSCDHLGAFSWITDSDTRIGPVCEVILIGAYRWLPFCDMRSITKAPPQRLLDLVWSQVDIELRDGTPLKGYMPMRYPVHAGERDALLMARETVWTECGRTGVHARGQKMWMTDAGDVSLLDLRHCEFLHDAG
ncbi:type VI secretion system accessory protein TagJ [Variovorax sp. J22R133]|uniref:type VI secretion system accessory protein TagJ n=1 Tax=Variovorax brevis TaxID=3053503 RepID=UPI002577094F|nr:type VI secretion system accessory protein TagJ [Variovorax sp. J22R133]MDM0112102.1 type VI secretion system accessory protein TagJ [Variovorax sp. J22R133]